MHVFRELLDKQIEDAEGRRMGRVDAIVAERREGRPPRIVQLELGFASVARRIHPRLERLAERLHRRFGVRRSSRYHVPWESVLDVDVHRVKVNVDAEETPAFDWERWLRRNVIGRIPGASGGESAGTSGSGGSGEGK